MPGIKQVRPSAAPATELHLPERVEHLSPDGEWNLVFHTPREWRMGADGWQVKLFHHGRNVTEDHGVFFRIAGDKGFRWERHFQPWSFDSKSLAMLTWEQRAVHLYEVAAKRDKHLSYEGALVHSVQWAPDMDRLLLTFPTQGVLVDQTGKQHTVVQWEIEEYETPNTYWMKSGNLFFLLARPSGESKTKLRFYSGVDGTLQGTYDVDPIDLVPYRREDYVEISRDRFSLVVVDPPVRAVGSLLDSWNSVVFEQASNTLFLSVYRPVSSPYQQDGEVLCKVQPSSVSVELDPS